MKAAGARDECVARPEIEVVGIAEDDLGTEPAAKVAQIAVRDAFDCPLRAHGHERRCLHEAMASVQLSTPGCAITSEDMKREPGI